MLLHSYVHESIESTPSKSYRIHPPFRIYIECTQWFFRMLSGAIYLFLARCITSNRMFLLASYIQTSIPNYFDSYTYIRHFTGSFSKG